MPTEFELIQSEKSYLVQEKNFYLISFKDKRFSPNKIEVAKLLRSQGLTPLKITTVTPYKKQKRRGGKSRIVSQLRPKKYYVKLQAGQKIAAPEEPKL
jgi:ribosomal protein L23